MYLLTCTSFVLMVVPSLHDLLFFEAWCFANFKAALILLLKKDVVGEWCILLDHVLLGRLQTNYFFFSEIYPSRFELVWVGFSWFESVSVGLSRFQSTEVDFNQLEAICLSRLRLFLVILNWLHTLSVVYSWFRLFTDVFSWFQKAHFQSTSVIKKKASCLSNLEVWFCEIFTRLLSKCMNFAPLCTPE